MNKPTLYYIPIEPLTERYTQQWYDHFPSYLESEFNVVVIDGTPLTDTVEVGTFLDINSTIAYKNSQLIQIANLFHNKQVEPNSVFFFGDLEFWGIESIRLMSDMNHIPIKIYAFLHAASYIKGDAFEIASPYQKYIELGWILMCDKVFIATIHHADIILHNRGVLATSDDYSKIKQKLVITGNPLFEDAYKSYDTPKQNKVLLTNRFDDEKNPNDTLDIFVALKKRNPDWQFVITTGRKTFSGNNQQTINRAKELQSIGILDIKSGLSKDDYHKELHESKLVISNNTTEETFGYCIAEAAVYDSYPLSPNMLSHPELLDNDSRLLFNDNTDCINKAEILMESDFTVHHLMYKYDADIVLNKMIREMV